jgi:hypothetical protein
MASNTPSFTVTLNDSSSEKSSTPNSPNTNNYNIDAGNKSIDYILRRNEALDIENKELRDEMKELSNRLEEEEGFNDKNDKRINEMKGLTKNLVESKLIMEAMMVEKDKISKNYNDILNKNETLRDNNDNFIMILASEISIIMIILGYFNSYTMLLTIIGTFAINYYLAVENIISNMNIIKNNNSSILESNGKINSRIKTRNAELLIIKNATDFLNDHIDNI